MAGKTRRVPLNISLDPELKEEFLKYAEPMGITPSAWVRAKMREFVEEQKEKERQ